MDVQPLSSQSDSSARCPRCGGGLHCGSATRPFDCWCTRMPTLSPLPTLPAERARADVSAVPPAGCLCPACYALALAASDETVGSGDADRARHPSFG